MFYRASAFNQDLSGWCVTNTTSAPTNFGNAGTDPVWGTCPGPPDAPTNLTATPSDTTITLTWKAPSSNGGSAIANYKYSKDNGTAYTAFDPAVTDTAATITGLTNGTEYEIKLRAVNALGDGAESAAITVLTSSIDEENMPTRLELFQNYPNPFNPSTTINYSIKEAGAVTINVYNLMGQKVATLVDETKAAGHLTCVGTL
jgi:predicted phage tail protein